jgi:hypothetical protein
MAGPKVYVVQLKVHVFDFSLASGWVVMAWLKVYMVEHKIHMFNLILG